MTQWPHSSASLLSASGCAFFFTPFQSQYSDVDEVKPAKIVKQYILFIIVTKPRTPSYTTNLLHHALLSFFSFLFLLFDSVQIVLMADALKVLDR